jgi:hypothetical protein
MKKLFVAVFFALSAAASAQVLVDGHTRKDGTYVAPHFRTNPDNTIRNNYSTQGNVNPYTGRAGTVSDNGYDNSAAMRRQAEYQQEELNRQMQQQRAQLQRMQQEQQSQMEQMQRQQIQPMQPMQPMCGLFCN